MDFQKLKTLFVQHEKTHKANHLQGIIVFEQDPKAKTQYDLRSRSYYISSTNYTDGIPDDPEISCMDGSDQGLRLSEVLTGPYQIGECYLCGYVLQEGSDGPGRLFGSFQEARAALVAAVSKYRDFEVFQDDAVVYVNGKPWKRWVISETMLKDIEKETFCG